MKMKKQSRGKPVHQVKIAKERIEILMSEAAASRPEFARRYMKLAKKIGMRYNVRLGEHKKKFCKYCFSYYTSENSTRRLKNGILSITCKVCKKVTRIPYK
jgi:RNase P subunit RPR2